MKFSKAFQIMEQYHLNTVKDVFLMIRDLAFDYDGQNTVEGLKELIDEIKNLADVGVVLEALESYNEEKKEDTVLLLNYRNEVVDILVDDKKPAPKEKPAKNNDLIKSETFDIGMFDDGIRYYKRID